MEKIIRSGLRVMAGFIIGFDGEEKGAGDRIVRFVEQTTIPIAMFSMLQVLPNTALWHRLNKEGRLIEETGNANQTTLMNFLPTRPIEEIALEYVNGFYELYDPQRYLDRTYRHFMMIGEPKTNSIGRKLVDWKTMRALFILCWYQGVMRETRWTFWRYLWNILRHKPRVLDHYLVVCGQVEHFYEYRQIVKDQIEQQLKEQQVESLRQLSSVTP